MVIGYYYKNIESAEVKEKQKQTKLIVVGHEGCPHRIPSKENLIKLRNLYPDKRVHLITPLISQKNIEHLKQRIEEILCDELVDSISFNDYGMVYYFTNKYKNKHTDFYMGRLLTKSFSDCPWSENIIDDESSITKEYMRSMTINDIRKIEFFKNMGIRGIEVSVKKNNYDIEEIKRCGLKIMGHVDTTIAAASRICTQGGYFKREFPECTNICNKSTVAQLSEIWSFKRDGFIEPSKDVKEMSPTYYINGNITYYKTSSLDNDDIKKIDYDYLVKVDSF